MSSVEEHDREQAAITRRDDRKLARLQDAAPALADALHYLLEQTVEQDLRCSIDLTEGKKDAYRRARAALEAAGRPHRLLRP